eukprot:4243025-Prymnesium_polylepis.1
MDTQEMPSPTVCSTAMTRVKRRAEVACGTTVRRHSGGRLRSKPRATSRETSRWIASSSSAADNGEKRTAGARSPALS